MSDLTYRLLIDLQTTGGFAGTNAHLEKMGSVGSKLSDSFSKVGDMAGGMASSLASAFTGAVEGAVSVAAGLAKIGAVAAGGALAYGVVGLNNQLELTKTSIAAILNAQGMGGGSMTSALGVSSDIIKTMRKDAADLPGEFSDLIKFFRLGSTPGFAMGASIPQMEKLSANAMAAAASVGVNQEQAAREFAMLLQGRTGAHNVFGTMLGFSGEKAAKFNAASGEEKLKQVETALAKYEPAIAEFSKTFDALKSTMVDNAKSVLGKVTGGVFDHVKYAMSDANKWFDKHETSVMSFAEKVGDRLVYAFELGRIKIREWTPAVTSFAQNAYAEIAAIWTKLEPLFARIGGVAKKELADPGLFQKLGIVGGLYGAVKLGGPLAGGAAEVGGGLAKAALGGSEAAGSLGLAGGIAAAALAIDVAAAMVAIGGALHVLGDESNFFHGSAVKAWEGAKSAFGEGAEYFRQAFVRLEPALISIADMCGNQLLVALEYGATGFKYMGMAIDAAAGGIETFIQKLSPLGKLLGVDFDMSREQPANEALKLATRHFEGMERAVRDEKTDSKSTRSVTGGGGTNIQKVEIVVTSNADPSRIGRAVLDELQGVARNPTSSRFVRNWGAARP